MYDRHVPYLELFCIVCDKKEANDDTAGRAAPPPALEEIDRFVRNRFARDINLYSYT